ncbi:MAG TPA: hypothetical protein VHC48_08530 [Puia sp.]|nr:hypothetical protein [Puia sp.]
MAFKPLRYSKTATYSILLSLLIVSCAKEEQTGLPESKKENGSPSKGNMAADTLPSVEFRKNYHDFNEFKKIADSGSLGISSPVYFFKRITFLNDTFCMRNFIRAPMYFKNDVTFAGCVFQPDTLPDEVRFFALVFDSSVHFQSRSIRSEFRFAHCTFHKDISFLFDWSDTIRKNMFFVSCRFDKNVVFENWSYISDERIKQPVFAKDLYFENNTFNGNVDLSRFTFMGDINFQSCILPDTINFIGATIKGSINITPNSEKKVNILIGDNFPIQDLKCGFSNYHLIFDTAVSESSKEYFLRQALEAQKKAGTSIDIQAADIALKDHLASRGDILLTLQKHLWNYGYDKTLLLKWMLSCFLIFYILNLFLFKTLIRQVYTIPKLQLAYENLKGFKNRRARLYKMPLIVFLYSCIIFFGWKLDTDRFSFKHLFLSIYIFLFYLFGFVLLFYFVGLILTK